MKRKIWRFVAALPLLFVLGWNGLASAGDVTVQLPDMTSTFNVNLLDLNLNLLRVKGNGYVGIGTDAPSRHLHVRAYDNIAVFESTNTGSVALLDLTAPSVAVGNLSRLCWRSDNNAGTSKQ